MKTAFSPSFFSPLLFSPSLLLLLIVLVSVSVPQGHAMTSATINGMSNAAAEMQDEQSHCAQMMAEAEKKAEQAHDFQQKDCCDECECSMATCSSLYSLMAINLSFSAHFSSSPTGLTQPLYIDPIQGFFKPPKVV